MGFKISELKTPTVLRFVILACLMTVGGFGIVQQVQAAQTPTNYCNQYPPDAGEMLMRSACYDGLKIADGNSDGATCQDYALLADQATVDVCQKALMDRTATKTGAADIVSESNQNREETPSPSPSPSPSKTPSSGNKGSIQDILDETKSLSDYIDVLHQAGEFADADMNAESETYGKYINGAGKKQDIHVDPSGKDNSPAIIIINGGGWHFNDQNDDYIRENKPDKTHNRTQTGPTAKQRGYTVFELTYRLGSSGVYYMFEDVMRGIKHVRDNADLYGIDPNKIALWGDSSGGSLAVRAGASGKSGAKVVAGWSPPTNAYTGLFRSYKSLFIGMDHSTCIPTDLAGLTNITDLITGGSGDVAEYGLGLSSNDFTSLGINADGKEPDAIGTIMQILTAGQYAVKTGQNIEVISQQLEAAYNNGKPTISSVMGSGLASGIINMSPKKLIECIDNFNVLSPAMFASPESPPMFLAGFYSDDVVGPEQVTGMRDKLHTLGIKSEAQLLPGDPTKGTEMFGPNPGNHLDYDARFVCPTLNFIDSVIQPDRGQTNCDTGQTENLGSAGGASSCSVRVDSEIRLRNVQSVDLAAAVVPNPGTKGVGKGQSPSSGPDGPIGGTAGAGVGTGIGIGAGSGGGAGNGSGNSGGGGSGGDGHSSSSGGVTSPGNRPSPTPNPTNNNTESNNNGGGAGGSGGGSGCSTTNESTPATTPTTQAADQDKTETNNPLSQLGNLAGNLGSKGGGFGSKDTNNSSSDGSSGSDTPNGNASGGQRGTPGDFTGDRGTGGKFVASKRGTNCAIDYSRTSNNRIREMLIKALDLCDSIYSKIPPITLDYNHAPPIQIIAIPDSYRDRVVNTATCGTYGGTTGAYGGATAFALSYFGRIYMCANSEFVDLASVPHEMVHLTQYNNLPSWLAESTAEYASKDFIPAQEDDIADFKFANGEKRYGCSYPLQSGAQYRTHYKDGYACGHALLRYIERQYKKPDLVKKISESDKKNNFTNSIITAGTNKTINQLYTECLQAECKGGKP